MGTRITKWLAIAALLTLVILLQSLLFNPLFPMLFSRGTFLTLYLECLATFLLSLGMATPARRLSMASITNRTPGSESL